MVNADSSCMLIMHPPLLVQLCTWVICAFLANPVMYTSTLSSDLTALLSHFRRYFLLGMSSQVLVSPRSYLQVIQPRSFLLDWCERMQDVVELH